MPLTCGCDTGDEAAWYYTPPDDYTVSAPTGPRKRCSSCKGLVGHGEKCAFFTRHRAPKDDIEERIHGDEVPLAGMCLCERCADLYFSFSEIGYDCVAPNENMVELANEYASARADDRTPG